ncbi:MAG: sigma-E processing peptidase SpoIIGA [Mollicutes bacterium]|nr:sigma-E processing peptidase SpoIIGA [Mollicutes bacterium]
MKIYLDLIFLLNFAFDFLLLLGVCILLRRNVKMIRLILSSFIGSLSIFLLFIKLTSLQLFLLKVIISIIMVLIAFGFKDFRYFLRNLFYLYTSSMILGGFLYYLNVEFSYKQEGLVFYHQGLSINVIFLVIFSPLIIYTYVRQGIKLRNNYANYYKVEIYFKNHKPIKLNGFLDTGNNLKDPYQNRPIILVEKKVIKYNLDEFDFVLVPYHTVNNKGLLKCLIADKIVIKGIGERTKFLVGIMEEKIKIDGIDCILHQQLMEG